MQILLNLIIAISAYAECAYLRPLAEIELMLSGKPLTSAIYDCKKVECICTDGVDLDIVKLSSKQGKKVLIVDEDKKAAKKAEKEVEDAKQATERSAKIERDNRISLLKALSKERALTNEETEEAIRLLLLSR